MSDSFQFGYEFRQPDESRSIYDAKTRLANQLTSGSEASDSFTASDGAQVPYRVWRAMSAKALVLLLHGAFDYCAAFDDLGAKCAARGITAMAIDQRGFGATYSRGTWCGESRMIADAVEALKFLRARGGDSLPLFLIGESMGAAIAVHAAANAEALNLAGVALAAPGAVPGTLLRLFGTLVAPILEYFTPNSGIVAIRLKEAELSPDAARRFMSDPMVLHRIRPATLRGLLNLVRDAIDEAEGVRVPVLTMAGGKDDLIGILQAQRLHQRFGGGKEWISFDGGPHLLLHWKQKALVCERLFAWLEARMSKSVRAS